MSNNLKILRVHIITSLNIFFVCSLLSACTFIPYEEEKIVIEDLNQSIKSVDIFNIEFNNFLRKIGYKNESLPIKEWGLNELLLAQNFFNYDLKNAKKEWLLIRNVSSNFSSGSSEILSIKLSVRNRTVSLDFMPGIIL